MKQKFDICIVGLKCYDLLVGTPVPKFLGGIERLLVALAKGLAESGARVAFIVYDEGQESEITVDGITLFSAHDPRAGLRGLRFVHPRMTGIWSAMRRANADTYLQMGAGVETAVVAFGAHHLLQGRRQFIYCVGSDSDCQAQLPLITAGHEKYVYKTGLRQADVVVAQTGRQQAMLQAEFGLPATVIPMPYKTGGGTAGRTDSGARDDKVRIVWVGRIVEIKRLQWLLNVAERCPQFEFDIAGSANTGSAYANGVVQRAHSIANVNVHGRVSDEALAALYQRATALCCTSSLEGFPTTFLEAWSNGIPVVTTFDPDGVVAANKVGLVVGDEDQLVAALSEISQNAALYSSLCANALNFYNRTYTVEAVIPRYLELIESGEAQTLTDGAAGQ